MDMNNYSSEIQELIVEIKENRNARKRGYQKACRQVLDYAKEINDEALLGFAYYYLGRNYYYTPDHVKKMAILLMMKKVEFLVFT